MLNKLVRNNLPSIFYLFLGYINAAFSIVLNLTLIKYLSTSEFGFISIGRTIFQSFEFSHLGVRYAFDRLLPDIIRKDKRIKIFKAGFIFNIFSSIVFIVFWSIFYFQDIKIYIFFILSGFLYSIIQLFRVYYRTFDNKNEFIIVSALAFILPTFLQFLFFIIIGMYGIGLGLITSYVTLYYIFRNKIEIKKTNNTNLYFYIRYILNKGYLLFFVAAIAFFATSGDRILIQKYWGMDKVGEYSVVLIFPSLITIFSTSLTELLINKIIKNKSASYIYNKILMIALIVTLISTISYFLIPLFLNLFIPKYIYMKTSINLAIFLSPFISVIPLLEYHLHSIDKRNLILYSQLIAIVLYICMLLIILSDHNEKNIDHIVFAKYIYLICYISILLYFTSKKQSTSNALL